MSELFTFLVTLLRCPALPLSEALFHGGKSDASDSRVSTERALFLALPEEDENGKFLATSMYQQLVLAMKLGIEFEAYLGSMFQFLVLCDEDRLYEHFHFMSVLQGFSSSCKRCIKCSHALT